jgi:glycyl-tRNA synthetase beta chain
MPNLLLELFSEEIPARMQSRAEQDLARLLTEALAQSGLQFQSSRTYSGPRRIAFVAEGLPDRSAPTVEERKGPRVGAPEKAIEGFLRAAGLKTLDECRIERDPKGDYYLAKSEKPGRATSAILAEAIPEVVRKFPWPKSMRWGSGRLRWVRPLHSILCLFDNCPVEFEVDGVKSGAVTYGHRFLSGSKATEAKSITIAKDSDYPKALMHAKVVVAGEQRAKAILDGARNAAAEAGLALVEDHGLLLENAGLVEWPVVLSGKFDAAFLDVPEELLMTAMKAHQKCFSVRNQKTGQLANRFILVSNLEAEDGGKAIVAGNERVIRARLSDAKFFWDNDRNRPLDGLTALLGQVTFHEKLGTQLERVERLKRLAREIAPLVGADPAEAERAAHLAKADLMSETVGEFDELQGIIGRYIALAQAESPAVADAIADHYKPQGPSDTVPSKSISIAVALADKIDILVGFWAINEKPTGSKDPFALRRAALGVIRILLENKIRARLAKLAEFALSPIFETRASDLKSESLKHRQTDDHTFGFGLVRQEWGGVQVTQSTLDLLTFLADRLKVYLRDKGARHDLIDAVFALPGQDDLLMIVRRVEALGRFIETEEGASLLALVRRALNILRIEEKKEGRAFEEKAAAKLFREQEEKGLNAAVKSVAREVRSALTSEDFEAAMAALAKLRAPVDAFFEAVTVNADSADLRVNRLALLAQIRALTLEIADFSKIEG